MTTLFSGGGGGGGGISIIGFGGVDQSWIALRYLWPINTLSYNMYSDPNYIVRYPMTSSGVIRKLYVCGHASSPGVMGTFTVSVRKNGILQSLGLTFNPFDTEIYLSNLVDSFTVAAGDYLEVTGISDANCNHQINVFMEFAP